MSLWAIVPIKPLSLGKSRLAAVMPEEKRHALNQKLYQDTLRILQKVDRISNILVVSRDSDVLAYSREIGIRTVQENGTPDLNEALRRASLFTQLYSPNGLVIVPADLPLLTESDVIQVIEHCPPAPGAVIVPDRRREGTNILLINPPDLISFSFGFDSFNTHCRLIKDAGARLTILENDNIALDLDLPEDLLFLEAHYKSAV